MEHYQIDIFISCGKCGKTVGELWENKKVYNMMILKKSKVYKTFLRFFIKKVL
jgi:hypothetical protein